MLAYVKAENAYADAMLAHIKPLRNQGLQRDHRPPAAGRLHRAVPHERLLVLPPLRDRQGIPHLLAPRGRAECARGNPAERQRAGEGPRLLRDRRHRHQPQQQAHGLGRRHRRPAPVRGEGHGPRHAQDLSRSRCPTSRTTSSGRATTRPSSTSRRIRRRCSASACAAIGSTAPTTRTSPRIRWCGRRKTRASTRSSYRTKDEKYLLIHTQSTVSTEVLVRGCRVEEARIQGVPAARARPRIPGGARQRPLDRAHQLAGEELPHRRSEAAAPKATARNGQDIVAHRDDAFVDAFDVSQQLPHHRGTFRRPAQAAHPPLETEARADVFVTADEPSYTMALDVNREFDSDKLRYTYSPWSRRTPRTTTTSRPAKREMLKREPVLGGYDPANYATEFAWATARDGAKVPVSIVYARPRRATAPRRCCRSATAPTAPPTTPSSPTCRRRCSIAASSSPSRTSAAARRWAAPGTRTASC